MSQNNIKRRALIIASPLKGTEDYLPGVEQDVNNTRKFLMSSVGGAWNSDEIITLKEPTVEKLKGIPRYFSGAEISLLIYSGHGYMSNGKTYININSNESIAINKLATKSKREVMIIDACRTECMISHFEGIGAIDFSFDIRNREMARRLMDKYISMAPIGRNIILSASPNEAAMDTESGGAYTVSLLESIMNWYETNSLPVLTVKELFYGSRKRLYESGGIQTPQYLVSKKYPLAKNIPFAVNTKMV